MQNTSNKMGSQLVTKMLFGRSMPIICSMMIQALYNVVDSIFVALISGDALTAVSIVFPFQLLMIALATSSCVGINILLRFTADAVAAYGICSKLQNFVFMPIYGWSNGMVPAFSYNLSAGKTDRIKTITKVSITIVFGITLCGTTVCSLFTHGLLNLFDASDKILKIGTLALRIFVISFPFAGFSVISGSVFQASGKGCYSIILTAIRQFAILIPCTYCLSMWFGLNAIWWSFLLAE